MKKFALTILFFIIVMPKIIGLTTTELAINNRENADIKWTQFSKSLDLFINERKEDLLRDKEYLIETNRFLEHNKRLRELERAISETKAQFLKLREDVSLATSLTIEKPLYQKPLYSATYLTFTEEFIEFLKNFLMIQDEDNLEGL